MSQNLNINSQDGLLVYWNFDEIIDNNCVLDLVSNNKDQITGYVDLLEGVKGNALRIDGFTTKLIVPKNRFPETLDQFSISAWVAFDAYPWNNAPIIENYDNDVGFFFGITARGTFCFRVSIDGNWIEVQAEGRWPLYKWAFITCVFDSSQGIFLYVNGELSDSKEVNGNIVLPETPFHIGKAIKDVAVAPTDAVNPATQLTSPIVIDAIIDELKFYDILLSADQIREEFSNVPKVGIPPLEKRGLPRIPKGTGRFGAYYTKLKYYKEWDRLWRIREHADVVVNFDDAPFSFVFWRGTSYIPCWVTGNGIWYTNEFNETWADKFDPDINGCAEPMSDKQCKTSHVRIIESNDVRVIVHWRYALVDTNYRQARGDPLTKWGDWSDEYYVIYPDGIGIRDIKLHSSQPMESHEFQESIVILGEGMCPEDAYEMGAVTLINMKGESHTYSWENGAPTFFMKTRNKNIQVINIKSENVPFLIVSDGPCSHSGSTFNKKKRRNPFFWPYCFSINYEISHFPWWNHWPVAQIPSDGRNARFSDRPAHSSISSQLEWEDYEITPTSRRRIMMHGLWDKTNLNELPDLAKSWLRAPKITLLSKGYEKEGYFKHERAYYFKCKDQNSDIPLEFTIDASEDNPVVNPAFVIRNLQSNIELRINGEEMPQGNYFRYSIDYTLEENRVIIWIKHKTNKPTQILITPISEKM